MSLYCGDTRKARNLRQDGSYEAVPIPDTGVELDAQAYLMEEAVRESTQAPVPPSKETGKGKRLLRRLMFWR